MNILVLNPGGNSLKIEVVACGPNQRYAFEAGKLISVSIEGIGKKPKLSRLQGRRPFIVNRLKPRTTLAPQKAF